MQTVTFTAYQGSDREKLFAKIVDCRELSHIGQPEAAPEMNHIQVRAYFTHLSASARKACFNAGFTTAWKVSSII